MSVRSSAIGLAAVVVLMGAGAAQSLSGSNTVDSGDIIDGQVAYADVRNNALTGAKILDNSLTGVDVNESSLSLGLSSVNAFDSACGNLQVCTSSSITLSKSSRVVILVSAGVFATSSPGPGTVTLKVNASTEASVQATIPSTTGTDHVAMHTIVDLPAGTHPITTDFTSAFLSARDVRVTAFQLS